jgi:hypothetical protein
MAMQVGFGSAFTRAFAVTGLSSPPICQIRASFFAIRSAVAVQSTPCGVMLSRAMKRVIVPSRKISEIAIDTWKLQILSEPVEISDEYR